MHDIWIILDSAIALFAVVLGFFLHKLITDRKLGEASTRAERIIRDAERVVRDAEREAENRRRTAELEAKETALKARTAFEEEARRREREFQEIEQRILGKEEELARKLDQLDRRMNELSAKERDLGGREKAIAETEGRLATAMEEQKRKLETIAGLTAEEAKRQLVASMEQEARREAQLLAMRLEEEARETAHQKAKEVLATTIQRLAPDYTVETAVSVVDLPSDDMKGRIIGREGRNIRALEQHTGVDLIVDDTPEAVLISAYDPYRREIARRALQILIADGRIHPARIEEVVEKVKKEMEQHLKDEGDKACFEVGVHGLHPELVKLVGRMKFRTSYGQNCLQ
ncbi:MAG: DUF3552 domain-containing protein, partial [Candidatus Rokubacteria bacterium]|nr:DUF3552 domain-containing protein [Candidatus Rokubacteria bacterium]